MYRRTEGGVWYFTVGGVRKSSGTTDKRRAEKLRDKERAKYWDAEKLGVKPARSWQQCVVEWARRKSEKASWKDDQSRLKWWHTHLGHIEDVRTITRQMVDGLLRTHRGARDDIRVSANATANRYAAVVGGILNMVCQELQWIDASPRMPHYPETKGRERWLSSEEWYRLYEALPAHLKAPAMFSIATGMRQSKVLGLEWGQINIVGRWLSFDGTDNKLGNVIPLNETAMRALEMARTAKVVDATHVWLYRDKPFTKPKVGWYNALKEAGLHDTGFVWHGLRHTWTSWLSQAGTPRDVLQRLGGWKSAAGSNRSMVERYAHYDIDHLRPYATLIDRILRSDSSHPRRSESGNGA